MKLKLLFVFFLFSVVSWGQTAIPNTTAVTQNFDGMAATLNLPTNWRMHASTLSPTYAAASLVVTQQASSGSPATGGTYNWGATVSERAAGAMTSSGFASPNNLLAYYRNTNASNLTQLTVSYKVERYRINTAAASVQFYYSLNGSTWTAVAAGAVAVASLPTGASSYTIASPLTINVAAFNITGLNIATNSDVYLRWNMNTTGSNSQGIGIDDVSVTGAFAIVGPSITVTPPTLSGMTYVLGTGPSTNQTFTASGSNLTNNIVLTAPTNYEISTTSSSGFGSTITLNHSAGVINATTIYVRLKAGLPVATYNGEIVTATSMGATTQNVTCNGSVTDVSGSNDLCSSVNNLVVNAAATSGNMTGSTFTAPFAKNDVWYSFTPTCTGTHAIIVAGFTGDIDIELFSGSCPVSTTTLDGSAGTTSSETISTTLTTGITYYLRVLAYDTPAETNTFTVQVSATSVLTLTNAGSPATGNISAGTTNAIIMGFATTPTCATNYSITNVTLSKSTVSTVTTSDISNFRIFYDANGNGIIDGGEISVSGVGIGLSTTMAFNLAGQTGITVARKYLLVADVAPAAVNGNKIKINLTPNTDLVAVLTPVGFGTGTALGSTQTISTPSCTAAVISSVTPASGPVGTEVTITGSSGNLAGATATFNGVAATVVSSSTTQLVVIVPTLATTGNLIITDGQPCNAITTFTVIDKDIMSCQGIGNSFTDLIISEVYDSNGGNVWHMELFNPTNTAIDLDAVGANYRLERFGTIGDATPTRTVDISGIILPGAVYLADLGTVTDPSCPKAYDFTAYAQGINASDAIKLTKEGVSVDIVHCPNEIGYTITRNPTAAGPNPTFNGTDWSTNLNETCADLSLFNATLNMPAGITAQPSLSLTCSSTSTSISVTATEGVVGGNPLAYQWYVAAPGASIWTPLTNTGVYSGATSNVLNISSLTGLNNYQYYCQVRENGATCYQSTIAVKITAGITTTWNGTAWSDGFPTLGATTIINGTYDMNTLPSFDVCSLIVNSPFMVTVTANKYINIQNDLTVNPGATLTVLNNGSLVQINNFGLNTGSISMKRTASIRKFDYVYWSSPVANFQVSGVSPGTSSGLIYKWNTTIANSNNGFGNWENANENMVSTKGYIIRGPNAFDTTTPQALTAEFIGVANNGIYTPTIRRGTLTGPDYLGLNGITVTKYDDNWNLVGNPYPSAIKALDFLNANLNLDGFVNLWTHGTLPGSAPNPFYGSYAYNYTPNDYITFNGTGPSTPAGFDGYIAAGQGFFVMMDDGAADATQTITFNNSMRSKGYDNAQFYRSSTSNLVEGTEKHRIWLDLISSTNAVNRMLVGYVAGATLGRDRLYDAVTKVDNNQNFYSLLTSQAFKIQGRPVPFDANDQVPLGVRLPASGSYTIALGATDGLFQGVAYPIFLEDKLLNVIHDLKQAPYSFTAVAGKFDNRFVLRYTNVTLGNDGFVITENHVAVATGNQEILIKSQIEPIKSITVYDVLGRLVFEKNNINTTEFTIQNMVPNQQALIVRITLENGQTINRKIVF